MPTAKPEKPRDATALTGDGDRLEALLDASRESADRLAELLAQAERAGHQLAGSADDRDEAATETRLARLSAHAEQMETAAAVAEAADQAKSCFLAAMSRELRTPVDGLARMIELLQQTSLDEDQRRFLRTANHSVCALLGLLDSVLSASQLDGGLAELRTTDFDLRRLLNQTVERLAPRARGRDLELSVQVAEDVPVLLRGEPGRIRQILFFLVRRAIQLATGGRITIEAGLQGATETTATVEIVARNTDTELSGPEAGRIFAPTVHLQAVSPTPTAGLGLTIARHIAELMGGQLLWERASPFGFAIRLNVPLDKYRQTDDDRRAHGRLPQELLQSSLGPVLDLSMGGMRVQCTSVPRDPVVEVELRDLEEPVTLPATVMWSKRLGFRRHEVGLSFPHVPPRVAKQLSRVSLNHRLRRLLGL